MSKFYNCYKSKKGYIVPKSPIIKNSPDIIEWLSTDDMVHFLFNDKPNTQNIDTEWISIGIGHSYVGNVYAYAQPETQDSIDKYFINSPYVKFFDEDYEAFMKYMRWVAKLGPKFTKQLINKNLNNGKEI